MSDLQGSILVLIEDAFNQWFEKKSLKIRAKLSELDGAQTNLIEWVKQLNLDVKRLQEENR